jgi:CubicO group peptidase (beta-lactamase class C family)
MIVAGRLLEAVTGTSYHDLLKRELYATAGMDNSCTSAEEAILRSTAVGHFPDPATMGARRTGMFMLPDTWAPAGATPIGTIGDLLAFGRTHLGGGASPPGNRVLSREWTARMQLVSHDMATPNVPPIGLGWLLMPFGETTVLSPFGSLARRRGTAGRRA